MRWWEAILMLVGVLGLVIVGMWILDCVWRSKDWE